MHMFVISVIMMLSLLIPGCGGGPMGDSENAEEALDTNELLRADEPQSEVATACAGLCRKQAGAADCPGYVKDDAKCRQTCEKIVSQFSGECASKAETYFNCGIRASWACRGGGTVPQLTNGSCASELKEYVNICFGEE